MLKTNKTNAQREKINFCLRGLPNDVEVAFLESVDGFQLQCVEVDSRGNDLSPGLTDVAASIPVATPIRLLIKRLAPAVVNP